MPLLETTGASSSKGFGQFARTGAAVYIEDVFSAFLYTGDSTYRGIQNGINLAEFGGIAIVKGRSSGTSSWVTDNVINPDGGFSLAFSNQNARQQNFNFAGFNQDGFTVWSPGPFGTASTNTNGVTYASWTLRKQPKFFDVVTWTGNGSIRNINHNLGSVPGCIFVKAIDASYNWYVYHRSTGNNQALILNSTFAAAATGAWNNTTPTSTTFTVDSTSEVNESGRTYVAYLFAHNAGGFGLTGTDNVISCGAFTTPSSSATSINLGYEPQLVLFKATSTTDDWAIADNMRGFQGGSPMGTNNPTILRLNTTGSEGSSGQFMYLEPTGFNVQPGVYSVGTQFIYIAIRRGPMRTPTSGSSVMELTAYTGNGASQRAIGSSVTTDMLLLSDRDTTSLSWSSYAHYVFDRLRMYNSLPTSLSSAQTTGWAGYIDLDNNTGWDTSAQTGTQQSYLNNSGTRYVSRSFRRAPGFFDVVCYTGNDATSRTINHNLSVSPELIILKSRSASSWFVHSNALQAARGLVLDGNGSQFDYSSNFVPGLNSATVFGIAPSAGSASNVNVSGIGYVAYLFASCPGVSRVGSYTGNGSSQTIDMGFTGGARFFLVKRIDSAGDWWTFDTARGMSGLNDPALRLNTATAETSSSSDAVSTTSVGLIVSQDVTCNINVNGATYIYLAIA